MENCMVTIDAYGIEVSREDMVHQFGILDQFNVDCDGYGINADCEHENFWLDRTLSYCPHCEDMHMSDICTDCGITNCDIRYGG